MTIPGSAISLLTSGAAPAGYAIERSLRFNSGDSAYLNRTPSSAGNRKKWTWSSWIKRNELGRVQRIWNTVGGSTNDESWFAILFNASDQISLGGYTTTFRTTSAVYRDCSAWMHLVVHVDLDASTTMKIWVNGVEQTLTGTANPSQTAINSTLTHQIGRETNNNSACSLQLADAHFIDGQALASTDFGEYDDNGVWQPKAYVASGPNNGTTWSSATLSDGGSLSNLFDGSSSTSATQSTAGTVASVTGFGPLTVSSTVSFYSPDGGAIYTLNGGSQQSFASAGWHHISFSGSLTSFTWEGQSSTRIFLYMMAVDGVTLIDGDTSNIGVNGFHLDFSDNSSNAALGTDSSGNNNDWTVNNIATSGTNYTNTGVWSWSNGASSNVTNRGLLFDGTINSGSPTAPSGNPGTVRYTWPSALTGFTKVRIYCNTHDDTYQYRRVQYNGAGGTYTISTTSNTTAWYDITSNLAGTFNWVEWGSYGGADTNRPPSGLLAIEVNDVLLIDFTPADIDSLFDSPTNGTQEDTGLGGEVSGNYATLNPLAISPNVTPTLSNGNLEIERTATSSEWTSCGSTFAVSSGKYYWELSLPTINGTIARWGVADADDYEFSRNTSATGLPWLGSGTGTSWSMDVGGNTYHNGSTVSSSYTSTVTTSDVIGVALDCDANSLTFYKNGTSLGVAHSNVTASRLVPAVSLHAATHNKIVFNFGQRAFAYTAPSGFKALNTANLSDPTIADGSTAMDVVTYTGTGASLAVGDPVLSATADSGVVSASQIFNGSTSDGGYYNGTGTDITLTTSPFTINTSLRVYQNFRSDGTYAICLNSSCVNVPGTGTNSTAFRWSTVDLSTFTLPLSVTKLGYSLSQNSGNTIRAIEVDGAILINGAGQPVNFEPDFVWIKRRDVATSHMLYDQVRGTGATAELVSNARYSEGSVVDTNAAAFGYLNSFDTNGFTVQAGTTNGVYTNQASSTYVGWTWDAGTSNTSITAGSLNSSAYDQRTTWTNGLTADDLPFNNNYPASQFFDGNKNTFASTGGAGGGNSSGTVDLGNFFPSSDGPYRVEVGCTSANPTVTIGGVQHDTADPSNPSIRIWTNIASVPSIVMDDLGAFGGNYIAINGKILVDTSVTPPTQYPSIASTVRANPSAGFSIVSYTGTGAAGTVGHGLNAEPYLIIAKDRNNAYNWQVYHNIFANTASSIVLNSTAATDTGAASVWNSTAPTSSIINIGTSVGINTSASDYIIYCFAPVEGYSAFGSYTGNGSTDGPFVYTGFRSKFVLIKSTSIVGQWGIWDTERNTYNVTNSRLSPNLSNAEISQAAVALDVVSNGFKIKNTDPDSNQSGASYLYACFSENPFKTARAR